MLLLKIIFALMLMYAFFSIVTWLSDADNHESISLWLSENFESTGCSSSGDSDSDGGSSDGGSSSDGGGGSD